MGQWSEEHSTAGAAEASGVMPRIIEGELDAGDCHIAIVAARFNQDITDRLLQSALSTIESLGGDSERVAVARVPGSLELAPAARRFTLSGQYDAVICLGCVIRGETAHYDCVVQGATQAITAASAETGVPVIFGVLTTENREQAEARVSAEGKMDTGAYAARAAVEMANLLRKL